MGWTQISNTSFFTKVGPSETYTSVNAAVTAGKDNLWIVGDTTETADITPTGDLLISVDPNAQIDMQGNGITVPNNRRLVIDGIADPRTASISKYQLIYTRTSPLITPTAGTGTVALKNLSIDNQSVSAGTAITNSTAGPSSLTVENVLFNVPNVNSGGINSNNHAEITIRNLVVTGGGAAASFLLFQNVNTKLFIEGLSSFAETINAFPAMEFSGDAMRLSDIYLRTPNTGAGGSIEINAGSVSNFEVFSLTNEPRIDIGLSTVIDNIKTSGNINTNGDDGVYNNLAVAGTLTVTANNVAISNGYVSGGATLNGNFNMLSNLRVGAANGGGANTVTVSGNQNMLTGLLVDAAVSDGGTGTVQTGVTIY